MDFFLTTTIVVVVVIAATQEMGDMALKALAAFFYPITFIHAWKREE